MFLTTIHLFLLPVGSWQKIITSLELWELLKSQGALWRKNKCLITNATIQKLFDKMQYWYGLTIHIENNNVVHRYGLTIKRERVRELLNLIIEFRPLEYNISGKEVMIRYK